MQVNPAYTRAAVRGATCHLRLGDFGAAAAMLRASAADAPTAAAAAELTTKLAEVDQLRQDWEEVWRDFICLCRDVDCIDDASTWNLLRLQMPVIAK